jgi:hypothetical protein
MKTTPRVSRRRALLGSLLAPAAASQTTPAPENLEANARKSMESASAALAKVKVPRDVEPAFQFKP